MRPFAMISSSIWRSKKFRKLRSDSAELTYFFLHTHEGGNSLGVFHMPPEQAAIGRKRAADVIAADYVRLQEAGLIRYDAEEELVQIVGFVIHSPPSSYKHFSGMERAFNAISEGQLKASLAGELISALEGKAAEWSDEVSSKEVFLSKASILKGRYPQNAPTDTPIHTPIIEAAQDTPIHTPTDTTDNTETETRQRPNLNSDDDGEPTEREALLVAMGHDRSGVTANGRLVGKQADMIVFNKWRDELGLTFDEILGVIHDVRQSRSYPQGGPFSFNFFGSEMAKLAGIKKAPALQPQETPHGQSPQNQASGHSRKAPRGIASRVERLRGASFISSEGAQGADHDGGGEGPPSLDHGQG